MNAEQIFKELSKLLPDFYVESLKLNHALKGRLPGALIMCCSVQNALKEYQSTEENENRVIHLLHELCKIHFSK